MKHTRVREITSAIVLELIKSRGSVTVACMWVRGSKNTFLYRATSMLVLQISRELLPAHCFLTDYFD